MASTGIITNIIRIIKNSSCLQINLGIQQIFQLINEDISARPCPWVCTFLYNSLI